LTTKRQGCYIGNSAVRGPLPANALFEDGPIMKTMLLLGVAVLVVVMCMSTGGCATPGLTARERNDVIMRGFQYDMEQTNDDIDDILLLRPIGHLTTWDLQ